MNLDSLYVRFSSSLERKKLTSANATFHDCVEEVFEKNIDGYAPFEDMHLHRVLLNKYMNENIKKLNIINTLFWKCEESNFKTIDDIKDKGFKSVMSKYVDNIISLEGYLVNSAISIKRNGDSYSIILSEDPRLLIDTQTSSISGHFGKASLEVELFKLNNDLIKQALEIK